MGRRAASNGTEWPVDCHAGVEDAIAEFRRRLPGWWYSLGECQVSCDASCAPTRHSADIELIDFDRRFESGFHADLAQPNTLAASLRTVMAEALAAREEALLKQAQARDDGADEHIACYDRDAARIIPAYDLADVSEMRAHLLAARGRRHRIGSALDVGAGSGRDARWLASLGYEVTAAEPSAAMRAIAMAHPENGQVAWVDTRLPDLKRIPRHSQDLVLVGGVWQHVAPERRAQAFDTLVAVLAPRGTLAIAIRHGPAPPGRPMHDTPIDEMPRHARRLGLGSLSSTPMTDALRRDDVRWILWTMRP